MFLNGAPVFFVPNHGGPWNFWSWPGLQCMWSHGFQTATWPSAYGAGIFHENPQDAKCRHHQDDMVHLEAFIWNRFAYSLRGEAAPQSVRKERNQKQRLNGSRFGFTSINLGVFGGFWRLIILNYNHVYIQVWLRYLYCPLIIYCLKQKSFF